jgi:hypothetical protein
MRAVQVTSQPTPLSIKLNQHQGPIWLPAPPFDRRPAMAMLLLAGILAVVVCKTRTQGETIRHQAQKKRARHSASRSTRRRVRREDPRCPRRGRRQNGPGSPAATASVRRGNQPGAHGGRGCGTRPADRYHAAKQGQSLSAGRHQLVDRVLGKVDSWESEQWGTLTTILRLLPKSPKIRWGSPEKPWLPTPLMPLTRQAPEASYIPLLPSNRTNFGGPTSRTAGSPTARTPRSCASSTTTQRCTIPSTIRQSRITNTRTSQLP